MPDFQPGGTGKTRLALQAAAELVDDFDHGVWLVDLAAVLDPALVVPSIALVLGVEQEGGRPLEATLGDWLSSRALLLLLDNFEQILDAAPVVARLLAAAPRVRALATSRAPLRLRGERDLPVAPLPLPEPGGAQDLATLGRSAAVRLFIDRALQARPDFAVSDQSAPVIAAICIRLDGLPLAIELAAARVRALAPESVLERLDSRLRLLTGGARDLPPRHQTIRAAIAWSFDLLGEEEQRLFRRLAVFAGGFRMADAEALCGAAALAVPPMAPGLLEAPSSSESRASTGSAESRASSESPGDIAPLDPLDGVTSLVEKSLLRHLPDAAGGERYRMLETVREYALAQLAERGEAAPLVRADALLAAANLASQIADARAAAMNDEAFGLLQSIGDARVPTMLRWKDYHAFMAEGRHGDAFILLQELKSTYEADGNLGMMAVCEGFTAGVHHEYLGRPADSVCHRERALALFRQSGDTNEIAFALNNLGWALTAAGRPELAQDYLAESLRMFRQYRSATGLVCTLDSMGRCQLARGDLAAAREAFAEGIALGERHGTRNYQVICMEGLAETARVQRDPESAALLTGAAEALRRTYHLTRSPYEQTQVDAEVDALRQALGEAGLAAALARGRAMSSAEATAFALATASPA